jgi:CheY-like chemotaxis protein
MSSPTTITTGPAQEASPVKKCLRILYADDLPVLREITRLTLERDGHDIECVADGHLAMEKLGSDPDAFDLVITDHHMPDWNGLDLVTWLRSVPFAGKILVFTSDDSVALGEAYQRLHVDRILQKPAMPGVLRQVVAELAL